MAAKTSLFVVFSTLSFFKFTGGFLDIDELKSVHYGIDILNNPVVLGKNEDPGVVYLTSRFGQQYQCSFPDHTEQDKQKEEEEKLAIETGIPELLRPLESGPCLLKLKDWWTYEFCYGKYIRQYHVEDGKIAGNIIYLGQFESEYDWNNETNKELAAKHKNRLNRYHSQQYVNGSRCDLTETPRRAEVRFLCEEGSGDSIARIDEPESCVYVLTVHTTKICHHPNLRPPSPSQSVPITCNPVVSHDIYNQYLLDQEEERKHKEETSLFEKLNNMNKGQTEFDADSLTNEETIKNILKSIIKKGKDPEEVAQGQSNSEENVPTSVDSKIETQSGGATLVDNIQENAEGVEDPDQEILEDFDKGLDELSVDEGDRQALVEMKEDIEEAMQAQFSDIIKEAETELANDGVEESIDVSEAQKQMAQTLSKLLKRLKKAEKDVDDAEDVVQRHEEMKRMHQEQSAKAEAAKHRKPSDEQITKEESEQSNIEASGPLSTETKGTSEAQTTDDSNRVKVRITRVKSGEPVKHGDDVPDSQRETIEAAVKEELDKAGLESDGSKIQVKIITAGYYDTDEETIHVLSSEDSAAFNKMVVAILGGSGDAEREEKQHSHMVDNYSTVWGKNKKTKNTPLNGS